MRLRNEKVVVSIKNSIFWQCLSFTLSSTSMFRMWHHPAVPSQLKIFKYELCEFKASIPSALDVHIAKVHERAETSDCPWSGCGKTLATKNSLRSHILSVHGVEPFQFLKDGIQSKVDKVFACQSCPKSFKTKQGLNLHVSKIHDMHRIPCKLCPKVYAQRDDIAGE